MPSLPTPCSETLANWANHKGKVSASVFLMACRSGVLNFSVYSLYFSLEAVVSVSGNATQAEKQDAFSSAALWISSFFVLLTVADLITKSQDILLGPVAKTLTVGLTKKIMAAYFGLPFQEHTQTPESVPVHHFGFSLEHIGPGSNKHLLSRVFGSGLEMLSLIVVSSIEFPVVSAIFAGGVLPIALHSYYLAVKPIASRHAEFVEALDQAYYGIFGQAGKYDDVHYFGRLKSELAKTEEVVTTITDVSTRNNRCTRFVEMSANVIYCVAGVAVLLYVTYASIFHLENKSRALIPMIMTMLIRQSTLTMTESLIFYIKNVKPYQNMIDFIQKNKIEPEEGRRLLQLASSPANVEFNDVSFIYPGSFSLKSVTFTVTSGTAVALVGPSGCGKTTVLSLLMALNKPNQGQILIGGQDISQFSAESVRRIISVVPQNPTLGEETIAKNIQYALPEDEIQQTDPETLRRCTEKAAREAGLEEFVEEGRLDRSLGNVGKTVSGGQKQRVAIARALMRKAKIYVFDEPTSALDPALRAFIWSSIRLLLEKGFTVIVVTHDLPRVESNIKLSQVIDVSRFRGSEVYVPGSGPTGRMTYSAS